MERSAIVTPELFRFAADVIVVAHVVFVLFVVLGALLVLRWRRVAWVHIPAALWGIVVEFAGWICPLTPLENYLRQRAGVPDYRGDFIEHYVVPVLYPEDLTRRWQMVFGCVALVVNLAVYWRIVRLGARLPGTSEDES